MGHPDCKWSQLGTQHCFYSYSSESPFPEAGSHPSESPHFPGQRYCIGNPWSSYCSPASFLSCFDLHFVFSSTRDNSSGSSVCLETSLTADWLHVNLGLFVHLTSSYERLYLEDDYISFESAILNVPPEPAEIPQATSVLIPSWLPFTNACMKIIFKRLWCSGFNTFPGRSLW